MTAPLQIARADTPEGQRLVLMIPAPPVGVSVTLAPAEAKEWADAIRAEAEQMSATGLVVATGVLSGNGKAAAANGA